MIRDIDFSSGPKRERVENLGEISVEEAIEYAGKAVEVVESLGERDPEDIRQILEETKDF